MIGDKLTRSCSPLKSVSRMFSTSSDTSKSSPDAVSKPPEEGPPVKTRAVIGLVLQLGMTGRPYLVESPYFSEATGVKRVGTKV
jgi:hypothetical protein